MLFVYRLVIPVDVGSYQTHLIDVCQDRRVEGRPWRDSTAIHCGSAAQRSQSQTHIRESSPEPDRRLSCELPCPARPGNSHFGAAPKLRAVVIPTRLPAARHSFQSAAIGLVGRPLGLAGYGLTFSARRNRIVVATPCSYGLELYHVG